MCRIPTAIIAFAVILALSSNPSFASCTVTLLPTPNVGPDDNVLSSISGTGPSDVWAAGWYKVSGLPEHRPLVELFDGVSWSIVQTPTKPKRPDDSLLSISARSPTNVWAVGRTGNPYCGRCYLYVRPFVIHWNGSTWSYVNGTDLNTGYAHFLAGVSIGPSDPRHVWFTGNMASGGIRGEVGVSYVEKWPSGYSLSEPPIVYWFGRANTTTVAFGVTAASDGEVWVVGERFEPGRYWSIEHFDGSRWSPQESVGSEDVLVAIDAASPTDVWAVGSRIEHYDGQSWKGSLQKGLFDLTSVSAVAGNDVWAAGNSGAVLHSNGTQWEQISQPQPALSTFTGIYGFPGGAITAGYIGHGSNKKTLSTLMACQ